MKFTITLITVILSYLGFSQENKSEASYYKDQLFEITKVMVHDVISPPVAARYYAYSCLGGYIALNGTKANKNLKLLSVLPKFSSKFPLPSKNVDNHLAAPYTLLEVGKAMLPSGYLLEDIQQQMLDEYRKTDKLSEKDIQETVTYAGKVSEFIVEYASTDGYSKLSAMIGYTPKNEPGYWYPTPPAYMAAIEPNWNIIRPFFLESPEQFKPIPPTPFSLDEQSSFFKNQLMGVYNAVKNNTEEQLLIAKFWDCNPFMVRYTGHMAIGIKKITPGGHWMGITGISCQKAGYDLEKTVLAHTLVALTLHDAFISCWDEKYRSDRIRPETVINKHIDKSWKPVLQTPPFPEYTSGHSVASSAAAVILTHLFGEDFSFVDDTEVFFGLPERSFPSFYQASQEAAMSRLYGGIHYIDACENGVVQGKEIGFYVVNKVK
ncbi:vanadium-dependent haloperoxidase [Galbibacter sp. BG1]|uniref:vanadium-dependent haloperoxidase n=1 Tax=Galbibacter sp. BG1 TaxID=1170699 RepID=UPI0015BFC390|nr:vanadium-dependent haloperoxidase [Galbibacter sp. BG1]QLE02436.1 vanadium-dependent haloperoxidase [Galbibacter sp. BG1]